MKNSVRIIAMVTAVILSVMCFAGCSKSKSNVKEDANKQVNLIVAFPFSATEDIDKVQTKINEELKSVLPNTTIELLCDASMGDKWTLWMSGKKTIDVAHTGFAMDLSTEIRKSSFFALDDLIDEYAPTIKEEESTYTDLYNTGTYNGKLYGIPCVQYFMNDFYELRYHTDLDSYFDAAKIVEITHGEKHTTEKIYEYLDGIFAKIKAEKGKFMIGAKRMRTPRLAAKGYTLINKTNLCYDNYAETPKIIDFHETDEYKTYIKYAAKWYGEGYISKDILTGEDGIGSKMGLFSSNITNFRIPDTNNDGIITVEEATAANSADVKSIKICMTPASQKYSGTSVVGSLKTYCSIPTTSKNPEKAIKLLELLRTDEGADILNLLCYGIEGTHYEKLSDTEIKAFDYEGQGSSTSAYGIPNWELGNMFNEYTCYPYTKATVDAASILKKNYPPSQRPPFTDLA